MGISPTLNIPQARFLAMQHKFKAYVAGFGSGKTWVGCAARLIQACTRSMSWRQPAPAVPQSFLWRAE